MWNLKCTIVPVIIGASEIVTRSLRKNLKAVPGRYSTFTTKDSYTWNITHNTESTAVWSLKLEGWGSLLVEEKYQEEKACDKRHPHIIIIIIIIILKLTPFIHVQFSFPPHHFRCSSLAVSVHTPQSPICISSLPSPIPSCSGRLAAVLLLYMSFPPTVAKSQCS